MFRKLLIISSSLILSNSIQANVYELSISEPVRLQNTLLSCTTLTTTKQLPCVTNVGNAVRNSINLNLERMTEKDRIYMLNLRGYPAEKAKNACLTYQNEIDRNLCTTKINLMLLSELNLRYLK